MPVLLPNVTLSARKRAHDFARDSYGAPLPPDPTTATESYPGAAREADAENTWRLRADPALWPLEPGDELTDGTRTWTVRFARPHLVPGVPHADYVSVIALLNPPDVP